MSYHLFKHMMYKIGKNITILSEQNETEEEIIDTVTTVTIYEFFWNHRNDKPFCDYDQMKILIQNTVRHQLHA